MYRSAVLFGRDHTELGKLAVVEITSRLAIGISRGRFPKGYAHVDPNEDAVFASTDGETTVLAVADGHNGVSASHRAIEAIAGEMHGAVAASEAVLESLLKATTEYPAVDGGSRSALSVCIASPEVMIAATFGDTGIVIQEKKRIRTFIGDREFLGSPEAQPIRIEERLRGSVAVIAASDGFFNFVSLGRKTTVPLPAETAVMHAERLIESAFGGGAGDHIAVAVHHAHRM